MASNSASPDQVVNIPCSGVLSNGKCTCATGLAGVAFLDTSGNYLANMICPPCPNSIFLYGKCINYPDIGVTSAANSFGFDCNTANNYAAFLNVNYMCVPRGSFMSDLSGLSSTGAQLAKFPGSGAERDITSATNAFYFKTSTYNCLKFK